MASGTEAVQPGVAVPAPPVAELLHLTELIPLAGSVAVPARAIGEELVAVRRHLHANPEPSREEYETTRFLANRLRDEARIVQQFPEAVRVAGEMMPELRRADAGIDADEQHAHGRPNAIP